ncbi:uncharacterized protein Tco025E_07033 [Trypanosoma conorhini]|uniref:Uncharacterized protein n=1 Tax=Trypanosoma conorhini TaxID=83891 RepID=A0A422NUL2_9TRYP|nr:uncharacterized protein Tco025E_07033 [Trypanosoma conorhini]RNF09150.1 hypothetical protein Tco025E_07033 [Trypanosoma conorhini]
MSVVAGDALQERCDAIRAMPPNDRPPDALRIFSQTVQELQRVAKEKMRHYFAVAEMTAQGSAEAEQRRQAKALRMQALMVLQRAADVGEEIRALCLLETGHREKHGGTRGSVGSGTGPRRDTNAVQLRQPPLIAAQMLLLVRATHAMMQEMLVAGGGGGNATDADAAAASQREMLQAIQHAKRAYDLAKRVAVILRREQEAAGMSKAPENAAVMRHLANMEEECSPLQCAKSEMQLAFLRARAGQHEKALRHHRAAAQLLTSLSVHGTSAGNGQARMAPEANQLLPVALFNWACQLEQLAAGERNEERQQDLLNERSALLERAREVAQRYLEPTHPLRRQLQQSPGLPFASSQADGGAALRGAPPVPQGAAAAYVFPRDSPLHALDPFNASVPHSGRLTRPSSFLDLSGRLSQAKLHSKHPPVDHALSAASPVGSTGSHPHNQRMSRMGSVHGRRGLSRLHSNDNFFRAKHRPAEVSQAVLQCHRLRSPSDALRLGGVVVVDTLYSRQHAEIEAEKKREEEEKKMRRRKRRQRSFLPEHWDAGGDVPHPEAKKQRKKKKKSVDKYVFGGGGGGYEEDEGREAHAGGLNKEGGARESPSSGASDESSGSRRRGRCRWTEAHAAAVRRVMRRRPGRRRRSERGRDRC